MTLERKGCKSTKEEGMGNSAKANGGWSPGVGESPITVRGIDVNKESDDNNDYNLRLL